MLERPLPPPPSSRASPLPSLLPRRGRLDAAAFAPGKPSVEEEPKPKPKPPLGRSNDTPRRSLGPGPSKLGCRDRTLAPTPSTLFCRDGRPSPEFLLPPPPPTESVPIPRLPTAACASAGPTSCRSACARSADRTLCPCASRTRASRCRRKKSANAMSSARRLSTAAPISRVVAHPEAAAAASSISDAYFVRSAATCDAVGRFPGTGCSSCRAMALSVGSLASSAAPSPSGRSTARNSLPTSPTALAATSGQHSSTMRTPRAKHSLEADGRQPPNASPSAPKAAAVFSSGETYRDSFASPPAPAAKPPHGDGTRISPPISSSSLSIISSYSSSASTTSSSSSSGFIIPAPGSRSSPSLRALDVAHARRAFLLAPRTAAAPAEHGFVRGGVVGRGGAIPTSPCGDIVSALGRIAPRSIPRSWCDASSDAARPSTCNASLRSTRPNPSLFARSIHSRNVRRPSVRLRIGGTGTRRFATPVISSVTTSGSWVAVARAGAALPVRRRRRRRRRVFFLVWHLVHGVHLRVRVPRVCSPPRRRERARPSPDFRALPDAAAARVVAHRASAVARARARRARERH